MFPVRGVAPDVMLNMLGVPGTPGASLGVRNGVVSNVFGVAKAPELGAAPRKSELINGALAPPASGVSQ